MNGIARKDFGTLIPEEMEKRWSGMTIEKLLLSAGAEFSRLTNMAKRDEKEYSLDCLKRAMKFLDFILGKYNGEKIEEIKYLYCEVQVLREVIEKKFAEKKNSIVRNSDLICKTLMYLGGYTFALE